MGNRGTRRLSVPFGKADALQGSTTRSPTTVMAASEVTLFNRGALPKYVSSGDAYR